MRDYLFKLSSLLVYVSTRGVEVVDNADQNKYSKKCERSQVRLLRLFMDRLSGGGGQCPDD